MYMYEPAMYMYGPAMHMYEPAMYMYEPALYMYERLVLIPLSSIIRLRRVCAITQTPTKPLLLANYTMCGCTVNPVLSGHLKTPQKVFKTNNCLCRTKVREHSTIRLAYIKLPYGFKAFVLSILSGRIRQVQLYT